MLPAATSCSSGFQRWVRDLSISVPPPTPRRPSVSPSPVTSSRPPAPPPMTMMRCTALSPFFCFIFRLLRLYPLSPYQRNRSPASSGRISMPSASPHSCVLSLGSFLTSCDILQTGAQFHVALGACPESPSTPY